MTYLSKVKKAIYNPREALHYLNRIYFFLINDSEYNDSGVDIFSEDWDNMVILDACRYDKFAQISSLEGNLSCRTSKASNTAEWIRANFSNKELHDVVYVSGNGHYEHLHKQISAEVHEFIGVWKDEYRTEIANTGDSKTSVNKVVPPELVTNIAIDMAKQYPDKRLLIHYVQPHAPYLGPSGDKFKFYNGVDDTMRRNSIPDSLLQAAYDENLEIVLDEVENLLDHLDGKTIVTADHGENLGEREYPIPIKRYGHRGGGTYTEELVKLPWLELQNGNRRNITSESPKSVETNEAELKDHLEALGYA